MKLQKFWVAGTVDVPLRIRLRWEQRGKGRTVLYDGFSLVVENSAGREVFAADIEPAEAKELARVVDGCLAAKGLERREAA